ncbi:MAG: poly-gamma-glutamate synthase PgsB [Candidatus Eisenbacteria bacterium]|uniref:Poly-gamma-glutamate synthase PgsB n=1 Tax=Eiseniibacteriota bacterium TaxID=2212470 RepID=A0A937X8D4_UNCEI|nr:poly-gamma-glutamate synthase PgsB [Candidatus Eisenbacteria bacterium]
MSYLLPPLLGKGAFSLVLLLLLLGLTTALVLERARHRRMVQRIPIRIHVNGTRGKSSVARLIAAGLRAGKLRTFAKTTGSAARLIHPDGSEEPVPRRSAPNIREQIGIIRQAAGENAEALVIECMAVRPDLQKVTEHQIVRSTIGVITNVRPDHLEVMGPTLENVAIALSGTIPNNGKLFTTEGAYSDYLVREAMRRGTQCAVTTAERHPTPEEMSGFGYVEIPENVALALDVCEEVGVDRVTALSGMYKVTPDVGATTQIHLRREDKEITFVNAFAANDRESTVFLWGLLNMHRGGDRRSIVMINNRADRMRRAVDMAQVIAKDMAADWFVVVGDKASTFIDMAARSGLPRNRMVHMGGRTPEEVLQKLFDLADPRAAIMGIGNIGGFGVRFMDLLEQERSRHAS